MPGEVIGTAYVAIRPETAGFANDLQSKIAPGIATAAKAATAAFAAIGAARFISDAVGEAQESLKVQAQTEAAIKSTGAAARVTASEIGDLANALSKKAGVDDEVIQRGANMLLTFTNIRNEVGKGNDIFNQATRVALDMSAALGQDMTSSAMQLGKALQDPIAGVTALQRVGVRLTESQKDQIAAFVKSGETMKAQKIILQELTREFGGSAAAQATDADRAAVAWANFKEQLGLVVLQGIGPLLEVGTKVLGWVTDLISSTEDFITIAPALAGAIALVAIVTESSFAPLAIFTAIIAGVVLLAEKLGLISAPARGASDAVATLAHSIERMNAASAVAAFQKFAASATKDVKNPMKAANLELAKFAELAYQSPGGAQLIIDGMKQAGQSTKDFEAVLGVVTTKLGQQKGAADEAARANRNLAASMEEVHSQVLKAAGGQVAYQQSLLDVDKAQKRLDEVMADPESTVEDKQQATLDLQRAQLDLIASSDDLTAANKDLAQMFGASKTAIDDQIAKMEAAIRTNPALESSYRPIINSLRDLKAYLDSINGYEANATVGLRLNVNWTLLSQLQAFLAATGDIANLEASGFISQYAGVAPTIDPALADYLKSLPTNAAGTDYFAGGLTWVGEQGPELVELPTGSKIYPNGEMPSGGSFTLNFYGDRTDSVAVGIRAARNLRAAQWAVAL